MDKVKVELPDNYAQLSPILQLQVVLYLSRLDPIEQKAYQIGKQHLGTSFHLIRSNGFADFHRRNHTVATNMQRIWRGYACRKRHPRIMYVEPIIIRKKKKVIIRTKT